MTRILMILALLAVVIPFGWMVRSGHAMMSSEWQYFAGGIPVGIAICYAFWMWDNKIKERAAQGKRTFGD